jgi:two-component system, NarL family, nitrate/nitrite response regulator NarL
MIATQDGILAASTARSQEPPERRAVAAAEKEPSATIMVVVRGQLFRDGIQSVLQSPDRLIIADCETLGHVASKLDTLPTPDLFVVGSGSEPMFELLASIRKLRQRVPEAKWLVLSPRTDSHMLRETLDAGVDGLLHEDSPGEVLRLLTRLVLLGHSFVPASLARVLSGQAATPGTQSLHQDIDREASDTFVSPSLDITNTLTARASAESSPARSEVAPQLPSGLIPDRNASSGNPEGRRQIELSARENEILGCLVSGHSNKIIARKLDIAEATVKVHVKGLLRKMQVSNRTQAAIRAIKFPSVAVMAATTDGMGK